MNLLDRFLSLCIPEPNTGCWLWLGPLAKNGRPTFYVAGRAVVAARISYELFVDEIPKGLHACHHCDVGDCVSPWHIWLGTHAENMADASRKGRMHQGEANGMSKLTVEQVLEIRRLCEDGGMTRAAIGAQFNVGHTIVSDIALGKKWSWLFVAGGEHEGGHDEHQEHGE